jgi:hypothetical protein
MNIDNIRDSDDAIAYLEKLATDARRVSVKLSEFARGHTTYNPPVNRFSVPNGDETAVMDVATAARCHKLAAAGQDFFNSVFGRSF